MSELRACDREPEAVISPGPEEVDFDAASPLCVLAESPENHSLIVCHVTPEMRHSMCTQTFDTVVSLLPS